MARVDAALRWLSLSGLADRDRRAILIGLAIIGPAIFYVAAVKPYRAALSDVRAQPAAQRGLLERELGLLASAGTMPAALNDARTQAFRAEARLIRAANQPLAEAQLTGYLEEQAGVSRVLLQELRSVQLARRDQAPEGLRLIRVSLTGESDLEGVVRFLHKLESGTILVSIKQLTLERIQPRETSERSRNPRTRAARPLNPEGVMQFSAMVETFATAPRSSEETK